MKEILNSLFEYQTLSREKAKEALINIAEARYNHSQVAAFLSTYLMRSITVEELEGFREAMLELCLPVDFSAYNTIDIVGTGGDGKDTFNISTLACFVVAGAGYKVTKHGNYGVSSVSGSSNVMEYLGYRFTNDKNILEEQLTRAGICFLHAPLFHPAMKNVAPVRKDLGIRTFFNILGPIVNPALPKFKLLGVYSLELARLYNYLLQQSPEDYIIVHSLDGYDEVSLTGNFKFISKAGEGMAGPSFFEFKKIAPADLGGGRSIAEAALIFKNVLQNKSSEPQKNAVVANAALAINCLNPEWNIAECTLRAKESLESGKALKAYNILIELSQP